MFDIESNSYDKKIIEHIYNEGYELHNCEYMVFNEIEVNTWSDNKDNNIKITKHKVQKDNYDYYKYNDVKEIDKDFFYKNTMEKYTSDSRVMYTFINDENYINKLIEMMISDIIKEKDNRTKEYEENAFNLRQEVNRIMNIFYIK